MPRTLLLASLFAGLVATAAIARADGNDHRCPHPPPPPKEAVAACDGKAAGDDCAFTAPDGNDVKGTCFKPADAPSDAPLACAPPEIQR